MMMMFAIFRYDEMMEKSDGLKQFREGIYSILQGE